MRYFCDWQLPALWAYWEFLQPLLEDVFGVPPFVSSIFVEFSLLVVEASLTLFIGDFQLSVGIRLPIFLFFLFCFKVFYFISCMHTICVAQIHPIPSLSISPPLHVPNFQEKFPMLCINLHIKQKSFALPWVGLFYVWASFAWIFVVCN